MSSPADLGLALLGYLHGAAPAAPVAVAAPLDEGGMDEKTLGAVGRAVLVAAGHPLAPAAPPAPKEPTEAEKLAAIDRANQAAFAAAAPERAERAYDLALAKATKKTARLAQEFEAFAAAERLKNATKRSKKRK